MEGGQINRRLYVQANSLIPSYFHNKKRRRKDNYCPGAH